MPIVDVGVDVWFVLGHLRGNEGGSLWMLCLFVFYLFIFKIQIHKNEIWDFKRFKI